MKKSIFTLAFAGLFGLAASAGAATITFTADKALAKTDFVSTLALGKFDTNLGTLTGISFGLSGYTASPVPFHSMSGSRVICRPSHGHPLYVGESHLNSGCRGIFCTMK